MTEEDRGYLDRAVELGRRGWGRVHPNPMVGCVIVRGDEVVGEGWHEEYGGPHAEVHALHEAGEAAEGATLYVSLEPCRHRGKTPACTSAIARAGVARVVFGASDSSAEAGGGAAVLRADGVEVVGPTLTVREARGENPEFFHHTVTGRPWVALKLATSLDGRIAAREGERTRLTGAEADCRVHALRAGFDAVVVGGGTVESDDPLLTVREDVPMRSRPARVVLDGSLVTTPECALFEDVEEVPVVIFTREDASEFAREALEDAGATIHPVPRSPDGHGLDLDAVLAICGETGLRSLLCEGGATVAASLLGADLVERFHHLAAPVLLGEDGVPLLRGPVPSRLAGPGAWRPIGAPVLHGVDVETAYERVRPWSDGTRDERLWALPEEGD